MNSQAAENPVSVWSTAWRLLTFRISREEMLRLDNRHLWFGLFCTWIVGIGRVWDDVDAIPLQKVGIGSLVYVFALSLLLWLVIRPLAKHELNYKQVLTFVCLVAPPGLIYAIPVERFLDMATARGMNLVFLCIVASWRVALLAFYGRKVIGLNRAETFVATLLPLAIVMVPLTMFNLLSEIASAMGGLRNGQDPKLTDSATNVLKALGALASLLFLPLLIAHSSLGAQRKKASDLESKASSSD